MSRGAEGARKAVAGVLAVLASAVLIYLPVAWWVDNRLADTEGWVTLVEPLPRDPDVRNAVAGELTDVVLDGFRITGPRRDDAEPVVREAAEVLIESDAFMTVWVRANRAAHERLVAVLRDEGTAGPKARLELITAVAVLLGELAKPLWRAADLPREVPDVPADPTPDEARAVLAEAFDRPLADGRAAIDLIPADQLQRARTVYRAINGSVVWAAALAIGLLIGALLLSTDRWALITRVGFVVALGCLAVWLAAVTLLPVLARTLTNGVARDVSGATAERAAMDLGRVLTVAAIVAAGAGVAAAIARRVTARRV